MSDLESYIKETISNYLKANEPIDQAIADIAREFNLSYSQAEYEVERLMGEETNGGMTFKGNRDISSSYVKRRFKGE